MDTNQLKKNHLRRILDYKNIENKDFAKMVGVSEQRISNIFRQKAGISDKLIIKYAKALDVDINEFYKDICAIVVSDNQSQIINATDNVKEEDIRTKVLNMVSNILSNGNPEQLRALRSIAEIIDLEINEQKKAAPMMSICSTSKGRKAA